MTDDKTPTVLRPGERMTVTVLPGTAPAFGKANDEMRGVLLRYAARVYELERQAEHTKSGRSLASMVCPKCERQWAPTGGEAPAEEAKRVRVRCPSCCEPFAGVVGQPCACARCGEWISVDEEAV